MEVRGWRTDVPGHPLQEWRPEGTALPVCMWGCVAACAPRQPAVCPEAVLFHVAPCCSAANRNAVESVQYGVAGSAAFLECQPRSPQATVKWLFQRDPSDRRREVTSRAPQSLPWMVASLIQ